MKLTFTYNTDRDIWCILNYGKTSINSPILTKVYAELVTDYGDNPSESDTGTFITSYLSKNQIDIENVIRTIQEGRISSA